jgi:polyphenol oxidase
MSVLASSPELARGVEHREVELLVGGVERDEQVEDLVEHFVGRASGRSILLITTIGLRPRPSALPSDELGLRHRAFGGVDQQDDAVDHREDALDLAAEIGVAGGVDDVDAVSRSIRRGGLARMVMPRSFSRSLESIARSSTRWLSRKVPDWRSRLVDERGLAVVDVGDDGNVALGAEHLVSCYQVHSPDVVHVQQAWTTKPEADAMVTDRPGLGLCVLAADCTPVLFADPEAGVIGAAHAGWKGALAGVLVRTLEAMEGLGAARGRIRAAIGPTIGQASYEVGPDFREAFLKGDAASADLFRPGRGDRMHFDLPGFCERQLEQAGAGAVFNLGHDTCAREADYFSNRRRNLRVEADYGRNASVVMILA